MDVNLINPFIGAILGVLPQLGFKNVSRKNLSIGTKKIQVNGVALNVDIVGEKKGNVVYVLSENSAKKIASTMMMGIEIDDFDDMAKSAVSELSNMLTANSTINFSNNGINVDISVPEMYCGKEISIDMCEEQVIRIDFDVDGIDFITHIAIA